MEGQDLRVRLAEALNTYGLKQVNVAKDTGIHHTTLSLWLGGRIKGSNPKIENEVEAWLNNLSVSRPKELGPVRTDITRFLRITHSQNELPGEESELIPIRIDIEIEGRRVKEAICWESQEPYFTPQSFAEILCEDLSLPQPFQKEIAGTIEKRIQRHENYNWNVGECIQIIDIEIRMENMILRDRFLWDINNKENSPEFFAQCLCADLGLGGDIAVQIAYIIRERIAYLHKHLVTMRPGSVPINAIYRDNPHEWEPKLKLLNNIM
ncbi:unnamed protein product [Blepharisma stoltei]|uniref:Uncharacterized protein n=1 Tax=Blepharisma stoltei TaxID=1481888 RepID=A0AAU9K7H8_9CILI|nr:unnamed protein product [Blepharisma stoltei]